MLTKIQPDAAVRRYLFTAKSFYMFRVSQHPSSGVLKTVTAASGREVAVPVLWPVPEAAFTVFSTPDDGCCDTRNMYSSSAVNKYLHTVASGWIFINIEDATFHNLFITVGRSACFRRFFLPSSGAQNCTYSVRYLSNQYCYLLLACPGQASRR